MICERRLVSCRSNARGSWEREPESCRVRLELRLRKPVIEYWDKWLVFLGLMDSPRVEMSKLLLLVPGAAASSILFSSGVLRGLRIPAPSAAVSLAHCPTTELTRPPRPPRIDLYSPLVNGIGVSSSNDMLFIQSSGCDVLGQSITDARDLGSLDDQSTDRLLAGGSSSVLPSATDIDALDLSCPM
jgi:hypothetical protein